eukprot:c8760_g1_i1.p1 GENE.c8760_g1_i1~~c8760_g1_i1.p1  ORF type:complete len:382 (-),score=48.99 c8760_g1_i1:98-1243(-)
MSLGNLLHSPGAEPNNHYALLDCMNSWNFQCSRVVSMSAICLATLVIALVFCGIKRKWSSKFSPLMLILAGSIVQVLLLILHYAFFRKIVLLMFIQRCLYTLEFCVIFFFFAVLACRVLQQRQLITRLVIPALVFIALLVISSFVTALVIDSPHIQCTNRIWFLLSLVSFLVAVALVWVGFVITRQTSADRWIHFRMNKSKRLWFLIVVNCLSAVVSLVWDVGIFVEQRGMDCHTLGKTSSGGEVFAWLMHRIVTKLLPIWAVLAVCGSLPRISSWHGTSAQTSAMTETLIESGEEENEVDLLQHWKRDLWRTSSVQSETEAFNSGIGSVGSASSFLAHGMTPVTQMSLTPVVSPPLLPISVTPTPMLPPQPKSSLKRDSE